jgi:FkbM family methyltransferase
MTGWRDLSSTEAAVPAALLASPWGTHAPGALQGLLIGLARRTFLHRGKARELMTRLIVALGSPLDISFRGCRFRIEGRNNLMDAGLLLNPAYNGREIGFLAEACAPGGVFVDIGANIGLYSLPLARAVGPQGRVLAIDAGKGVLARLEFNARASGLSQVEALNLAVGGREGAVELQIRRDDLAIVSVRESADGTVRMRPLLAILQDAAIGRIDALKIDIEGHEDAALVPFLAGAPEALLPRRIVIEFADIGGEDYPGCRRGLSARGYRLVGRTRNNSLYARA